MENESVEQDENTQIAQRREKLTEIRKNTTAFPNDFKRQHLAVGLHSEYESKNKETLEQESIEVSVAGRIMMRRLMGKASFVQLQDVSGKIQLYVKQQEIADGVYEEFKGWDIGDIVGATGVLFKTKTGELSVKVSEIKLLVKSLRPLPDKWHGLSDQEKRYRQRYLDLIVNHDSRETFKRRVQIIQIIRDFFNAKDYMEVETPMMHVIPGGATARPFVTHHNTLDMELFLRIAPELYLKRLVVGGFERVYEINRNFRNEGLSTKHNPEFTMIEFYQAYATYHDMMDITEELLKRLAKEIVGTDKITYQGQTFDFGKPFTRISMYNVLKQYNPDITDSILNDKSAMLDYLKSKGFPTNAKWGLGACQFELFEQTVEDKLHDPTFITEYPIEVSPLARQNDLNPEITDRFEFFVGGRELANGFSELNDPEDQAARFKLQVESKDAGDQEAMHFDADYIRALEYGLPPTAGQGIGIDRLVMLFTDSASIRDVLLFPHMRPES